MIRRRIILVSLIIALFCQYTAMATDINELLEKHIPNPVDMERVFKYDYMTVDDNNETLEDSEEVLEYSNAVNLVKAIGLMENIDEDRFAEKDAVLYRDFANIILKLTTGTLSEMENKYDAYSDNQYTKWSDAVHYLVGVIGYDVFEERHNGNISRSQIAAEYDLLENLNYIAEKNITRGELAQLLYNILTADLVESVSFSKSVNYEIKEGECLLKRNFDTELIYGVVTAQDGFDVYTDNASIENEISIDRVKYRTDNVAVEDFLGFKVQALVSYSGNSIRHLKAICKDQYDETIVLTLGGNNVSAKNGYIYYIMNGKEKKIRLASVENAVINDTTISAETLEKYINTLEGEIRLCKSEDSTYDIAVIRNYSTYLVNQVSMMMEKIYLGYNASFDGKDYIDISKYTGIHVYKDGKSVDVENITPGNVIDVAVNSSGTDIIIVITDGVVVGNIDSIDGEYIYIDGVPYEVSDVYEQNLKNESQLSGNKTLTELTLGMGGEFKLNMYGRIVGYTEKLSSYKLGLLAKLGVSSGALDKKPIAKIFTEENTWEIYTFSENMILDGVTVTNLMEAYETIISKEDTFSYAPIRYSVNSSGELKFLDTAVVNPEEADDANTIRYGDSWSGQMNWTIDSTSKPGSLTDSKYFIDKGAYYIEMPKDKSMEDRFVISTKKPYRVGNNYSLELYNVDEFYGVHIFLNKGSSSSATGFTDNYRYFIFMGLANSLDENGEPILVLRCYDGTLNSGYEEKKYKLTDPEHQTMARQFKIGDIVHFGADEDEMKQMVRFCSVDDIKFGDDEKYIKDNTAEGFGGTEPQEMLGIIKDVDPLRQVVKVQLSDNEDDCMSWIIHNCCLFDLSEGKGSHITAQDIIPGDRVFGNGGNNYMRTVIIRE